MTAACTKLLNDSKSLPKSEQLSLAITLLRDGGLPSSILNQLMDQLNTLIAIERCERVEDGTDHLIPYEQAMRKAKDAVL
ncbi:MAG: hypothetical protein HOH33_09850 [Verrucomicrobia bacterium]|jgi:hypothetical protein|nr:hypothetical protein [Verrucomicrobiota bacterium]